MWINLRDMERFSYNKKWLILLAVGALGMTAEGEELTFSPDDAIQRFKVLTTDNYPEGMLPATSERKKDYVAIVEKYFDEAEKALKEEKFKEFLASKNSRENWIFADLDLLVEYRGELMLDYDRAAELYHDPNFYPRLQKRQEQILKLWNEYVGNYKTYVVHYLFMRSEYNHAIGEFNALIKFLDWVFDEKGLLVDEEKRLYEDPVLYCGYLLAVKIWRKKEDVNRIVTTALCYDSIEDSLRALEGTIASMWDVILNQTPWEIRNQSFNVTRWELETVDECDGDELIPPLEKGLRKDDREKDHIVR